MISSEELEGLAEKVEKASDIHEQCKAREEAARRDTTNAINKLREAQKAFDEAITTFREAHSDNFNNRWGK